MKGAQTGEHWTGPVVDGRALVSKVAGNGFDGITFDPPVAVAEAEAVVALLRLPDCSNAPAPTARYHPRHA